MMWHHGGCPKLERLDMAKKKAEIPFRGESVIYFSKEDDCWIAHSLHTDQMGYGDCIVDALADLFVALRQIVTAQSSDKTIEIFCEAPLHIQNIKQVAKELPECFYQIACDRADGKWPRDFDITYNKRNHYKYLLPIDENCCA